MNQDIDFNCQVCSQSLCIDASARGTLITCPSCHKQIEVPGARRVHIEAQDSSRLNPLHNLNVVNHDIGITVRTRNCVLGYVGLTLVCVSIVTGGLLLLPGLVCAHIAVSQCNRDPAMAGRSSAVAALIIGYILVFIFLLAIVGFVSFFLSIDN